jgi:hypothetical protein
MMTTLSTYEHETHALGYYRKSEEAAYRGIPVERQQQHSLYRVTPKQGFYLPRMLDGHFTSKEKLEQAIDFYIKTYPGQPVYIEKIAKRGRGRPKKIKTKKEIDDSNRDNTHNKAQEEKSVGAAV